MGVLDVVGSECGEGFVMIFSLCLLIVIFEVVFIEFGIILILFCLFVFVGGLLFKRVDMCILFVLKMGFIGLLFFWVDFGVDWVIWEVCEVGVGVLIGLEEGNIFKCGL